MWFGVTMWIVFTTSLLICTCSAYSSYSDFETNISGPTSYKSDGRWNELDEERNLYDTDAQSSGKFLDLNSWPEKDSVTLSRQLFGDKSVESPEVLKAGEKEVMPINKRESHSLSIVNPLDVLRQRLMLEMARRRMKENQDQIRQNEVILKNLGKRAVYESSAEQQQAEEMRSNPDYLRRIHMVNSEDFDV